MSRKSVTMVVSVAALGCLCGMYVVLKNYNQQAEEAELEAASGETVWELDTDSLVSAAFMVDDTEYTFQKEDDVWTLEGDETFPVDGTAVLSAVSGLSELKALRTLTDIEDTSDYGMAEPQNRITVVDADGEETVFTIGDTNEGTGDDYLMISADETTVYTVDEALRCAFSDNLYDYAVSEQIPSVAEDEVTRVALSGTENDYVLYLEGEVWKLEDDGGEADSDKAATLTSQIAGLYYTDFLEHNCQDFSVYGLEEPAAVLTVSYEKGGEAKTMTLTAGEKDEAGDYYVRLDDSAQVHTISTTMMNTFLDMTAEELEAETEETETEETDAEETEASS